MLSLWARSYQTKRYEFIKFITYNNRFAEVDDLDGSLYYEALVVNENQECLLYVELDKPYIRRKK